MFISDIIDNNIETLESAVVIFNDLSDAQYNEILAPFFNESIGKHFRHIIDHYYCFIRGLKQNHINYDQRQRDPAIETRRLYTCSKIQQLIKDLKALTGRPDSRIKVSLSTSLQAHCTTPANSSLTRELIFLQSHTIHHYAIISAQLKLMALPVDENFGVAVSTQLYYQQLPCAQ